MSSCACLGCLQSAPGRTVRHGDIECSSLWDYGDGDTVTVAAVGRCPRCSRVRVLARELCAGCVYDGRRDQQGEAR
jgi:hypothetical protein